MERKFSGRSPPSRGRGRPYVASARNIFPRRRSNSSRSSSPRRDDVRKSSYPRRSSRDRSRSRSFTPNRHSPPRRYPGHFRPYRGTPRIRGFRGQPFRGNPSYRGQPPFRGQTSFRGRGGFMPRPRSRSFSPERLQSENYYPERRRSSDKAPKRHWQSPPREYYSPERKRGSRITDMRHSPRDNRSLDKRSRSSSLASSYSSPRRHEDQNFQYRRRSPSPLQRSPVSKSKLGGRSAVSPPTIDRHQSPLRHEKKVAPRDAYSENKSKQIAVANSAKQKSEKKKVKKLNAEKKPKKVDVDSRRIGSPESQHGRATQRSPQPVHIPLKSDSGKLQEHNFGNAATFDARGGGDSYDHKDKDYRQRMQTEGPLYADSFSSQSMSSSMFKTEPVISRQSDMGRDDGLQVAIERSINIPGLEPIRRDFFPDVVIVRRKDEGMKPLFMREEFRGLQDVDNAERRVVKLMPAQQEGYLEGAGKNDLGESSNSGKGDKKENFQVQRGDELSDGGTSKKPLTERWSFQEPNRIEPATKPADKVEVIRHERSPSPQIVRKNLPSKIANEDLLMKGDRRTNEMISSKPFPDSTLREFQDKQQPSAALRKRESALTSHMEPEISRSDPQYVSYNKDDQVQSPPRGGNVQKLKKTLSTEQESVGRKRPLDTEKNIPSKKRHVSPQNVRSTEMKESQFSITRHLSGSNVKKQPQPSSSMVSGSREGVYTTNQGINKERGYTANNQEQVRSRSSSEEDALKEREAGFNQGNVKRGVDGKKRVLSPDSLEDSRFEEIRRRNNSTGDKKGRVIVSRDRGSKERIVIPTDDDDRDRLTLSSERSIVHYRERSVMSDMERHSDDERSDRDQRIVVAHDRDHFEGRHIESHSFYRGRGRGFNRNPRDLRFSLNRGSFRGFRGYQRGRGSFGGQWQGNREERQYHRGNNSPLPDFSRRPDKYRLDWKDQPESVPKGRSYFEHDNRDDFKGRGRGRPFIAARGGFRGSYRARAGFSSGFIRRGTRPFRRLTSTRGSWRSNRFNNSPRGSDREGSDNDRHDNSAKNSK